MSAILKSFLLLSCAVFCAKASCINNQDDIEYFFALKTNSSYWKWIKPHDPITVVTVSMQINRVALNVESTFDIQILLELEWYDDRLKFLGNECLNTMSDGNFTIEGNEWHYSKIWSPNLRFARNKDPNVLASHVMLLRITSTGHVRVRMRNNINLFCSMDYRKYPFDTQTCNISLVSSDQTEEKLRLEWSKVKDQQFKIDDNLFISSHTLEFHELDNGTKVIKNEKYVVKATQNFSMLLVSLHFKRQWGHYMLVVFFPSMLIVATSWLSFWVEITSPPARITLCVTTMLALVTVSKEVQQDLPKVPYIKATDLWFAGCTVSIFLSLIEYIIVAYTFRAESKKYKERKKIKRSLSAVSLSSNDTQTTLAKLDSSSLLSPMESDRFGRRASASCIHRNSLPTPQFPPRIHFTFSPPDSPNNVAPASPEIEIGQWFKDTPQEVAESIDRKSRILFPFMFIFFNLIYWSYYN